jgi:predicted nucleic acid-binding protein
MVIFELEFGARRVGRVFEFHKHFSSIRSYPLTLAVLLEAAEIQAALLRRNQVIGLPDTFIAATAILHSLPLFTTNITHFERVPALDLLRLP